MATTTRTIVGVFEDYATAQRVQDELIRSGFHASEVEIAAADSYARDAARGNTGLAGGAADQSGGGISGFFRRLFGADDDDTYSVRYSEAVQRGNAVLTVTTDDEYKQDQAAEILDRGGAVDIDERAATWETTGQTGRKTGRKTEEGRRSIPVIREDLDVSKRMVQRGGVRIVNRVVNEPVEEMVNLREEHVRVDRHKANRPANDDDLRMRDEVIEVTEMAEEPVINKRTRVVEDVVVGKETSQHTEKVRDTLRRTEVDVQKLGTDEDFRQHFTSRYGSARGATYENYAPAYRYGYEMASDSRYRGKRWEDIEPTLRSDYERHYPNSTWEQMKESVRYGWDKVTGRR
jgi:uncharacterized protein (TIGR02271 family)